MLTLDCLDCTTAVVVPERLFTWYIKKGLYEGNSQNKVILLWSRRSFFGGYSEQYFISVEFGEQKQWLAAFFVGCFVDFLLFFFLIFGQPQDRQHSIELKFNIFAMFRCDL